MRYEADGCEDFVGVVLGVVLDGVLSQGPIDFFNSGCVPLRAQFRRGLRCFGEQNDAGRAPP